MNQGVSIILSCYHDERILHESLLLLNSTFNRPANWSTCAFKGYIGTEKFT